MFSVTDIFSQLVLKILKEKYRTNKSWQIESSQETDTLLAQIRGSLMEKNSGSV